ncbi:hypothetical protein GEMRC1_008804 [Eukaryota sp. GEM-RC1]
MSHYLCDICHEILKNPVTTWCGHTFCMSDLQEWLVSHDGCPICRAEVDKSRLCPNYKLKEAIEAFVAGQGESVCFECDKAAATCYCAECNADLCDQCFKDTHRPKLFRSHVAIPLQKKHASIVPKCPIHASKSFDLFCTSCSVALCSTCAILGDHDQHKKKLLPFDEGRASVEQNINSINQELSVAIEKVTQSAEYALQQATTGFTRIKESLTLLLEETMLDSCAIMNDLKTGKPVVFKPKINEQFITTTSTHLQHQSSIISSLNEELLSVYSAASRRLTSLSVDSESSVASVGSQDDSFVLPIKSAESVSPVQQVEEKKLVIDWRKLSSELKNCYDQMVRNEVSAIGLSNNSIGPEGAIAIAEALKVNSSVTEIYLENNSIGPEGAIAIAEALKLNSSVTRIYLGNNSIGPEGAIAIAEALKLNSSVTRIYLGNNSIGPEGAIAIAEALKLNSSVSQIYLHNNSIGNEGAIAIAEALKLNSSVSQIYLHNNSIDSQTQQSLKSLHKNRIYF